MQLSKLITGAGLSLFLSFTAAAETLSDSLDNWKNVYPYGEVKKSGESLALISTGNWFLLSKARYSDFILEADVKMPAVDKEYSNSGIIFRAQVGTKKDGTQYAYGYQAEVDPSDRKWSGGLYEQGTARQWLFPQHKTRSKPGEKFKKNLSPEWTDKKANAYKHTQWNHYKIKAQGEHIQIWVNDVLTVDVIDSNLSEGHVGIQHHGSAKFKNHGDRTNTVLFKNIQITPL